MPESSSDFLIFIRKLNSAHINYVVTGSVAASIYGEPRLTHDVDLVVEIDRNSSELIPSLFPLEEFYCPPLEVINVEAARHQRGHFNLIHHESGFKADIYLCGEDKLQHWALDNARTVQIGIEPLRLAPPEYVIIKKLQYYKDGGSEKHLRDIAGIRRVLCLDLNQVVLDQYINSLSLDAGWKKVLSL